MSKGKRVGEVNAEYFEERIQRVTESGCWIWMLGRHEFGYGKATVNGKHLNAHRLSWHLFKGSIPKGKCVLHSCDIPECCNPAHLFLGTTDDNNKDMHNKGRNAQCYGEAQGGSKLTEEQVLSIREDNRSCRKIAVELGVSHTTISKIRRNLHWRHLLP